MSSLPVICGQLKMAGAVVNPQSGNCFRSFAAQDSMLGSARLGRGGDFPIIHKKITNLKNFSCMIKNSTV
jgi:hypothetical protein